MKKKLMPSAELSAVVLLLALVVAIFGAGATIGRADICAVSEKIKLIEEGSGRLRVEICAKSGDEKEWACSSSKSYERAELKRRVKAESAKAVIHGVGGAFGGLGKGFKDGASAGAMFGPLGLLIGGIGGAIVGAVDGGVSGYKLSSYKASADAVEAVLQSVPGVCTTKTPKEFEGQFLPALLAGLNSVDPKKVVDNIAAKAVTLAEAVVEKTSKTGSALSAE